MYALAALRVPDGYDASQEWQAYNSALDFGQPQSFSWIFRLLVESAARVRYMSGCDIFQSRSLCNG